jgi:hypothetical protein
MTSNPLAPIVIAAREGAAHISPDSLLRHLGDWLGRGGDTSLTVTLFDGTTITATRIPPPEKERST